MPQVHLVISSCSCDCQNVVQYQHLACRERDTCTHSPTHPHTHTHTHTHLPMHTHMHTNLRTLAVVSWGQSCLERAPVLPQTRPQLPGPSHRQESGLRRGGGEEGRRGGGKEGRRGGGEEGRRGGGEEGRRGGGEEGRNKQQISIGERERNLAQSKFKSVRLQSFLSCVMAESEEAETFPLPPLLEPDSSCFATFDPVNSL